MSRSDTVRLHFRFQMSLANLGVGLKLMFFAWSDLLLIILTDSQYSVITATMNNEQWTKIQK